MDAMEFFQRSAGEWRSQRTTHHLPFRRAETGGSAIQVETLAADHPKVIELCQMHEVEPSLTVGGAHVAWNGEMEWDKEDENHQGTTVFAIVPDADNPRKGRLLRERGYAEIVPVVGRYEIDDEDAMVLVTEYETMSIVERFWFANRDLRIRASTVKRFGGLSTATFCAEIRSKSAQDASNSSPESANTLATAQQYSISGW